MPHKGYKQTSEHRMKTGLYWQGKKKSPEHRAKLVAHLEIMRESGITPTNFGGKRHKFSKGHKPWNMGLPTNPGLEKMLQLPHGMVGKHHSQETKDKIKIKLTGNKNNGGEGSNNSFYGKHHSVEFIETRRKAWIGQGNPMYHDGQYPKPYPLIFNRELRKQIRERDNCTCQLCGIPQNGKAHDIHHIDYDKTHNSPTNLITLCHGCNAKVNYNRDGWQTYFANLLINETHQIGYWK